jgi:hypothetical protein
MKPAKTATYSADINVLAREIRAGHDAILKASDKAIDICRSALAEAILVGSKLAEVKSRLAHGDWGQWMTESLNFSTVTANTYMRIAESDHAELLAGARSIRHAVELIQAGNAVKYLVAQSETETPATPAPRLKLPSLARVKKLKPIEQWDSAERETFKTWFDAHVAPLSEIRARLN